MSNIFSDIKTINKNNFGKYGVILEHIKLKDGYEPLVTVKSHGWIWAIMTFKNKTIKEIECHPTSKESFEPVFGTTLIVLAEPKHPNKTESFLLDKPVMLNEGVWHNIMSLSESAAVKITENNDVYKILHKLKSPVGPVLTYK
jgi:ureidoglycolate hydrolase